MFSQSTRTKSWEVNFSKGLWKHISHWLAPAYGESLREAHAQCCPRNRCDYFEAAFLLALRSSWCSSPSPWTCLLRVFPECRSMFARTGQPNRQGRRKGMAAQEKGGGVVVVFLTPHEKVSELLTFIPKPFPHFHSFIFLFFKSRPLFFSPLALILPPPPPPPPFLSLLSIRHLGMLKTSCSIPLFTLPENKSPCVQQGLLPGKYA